MDSLIIWDLFSTTFRLIAIIFQIWVAEVSNLLDKLSKTTKDFKAKSGPHLTVSNVRHLLSSILWAWRNASRKDIFKTDRELPSELLRMLARNALSQLKVSYTF